MTNEAFFRKDGGLFVANPVSRGPWDPKSLHGRVVIGLLAHEIERRHGDPEFLPARLTVDMYRLPDFSPIEVATRVVRDGARIKVIDAEFLVNGVSMGRATCQLLRRTQNPEGAIWKPDPWDAPHPDTLPEPEPRAGMGGMWSMKPVRGEFGQAVARKRTWMKEIRELVDGEAMTPFIRAALAADFASPFANAGDSGLSYINTDVTLYLHRAPVGGWIGFEVSNHQATDGVAIGECTLHDVEGSIGTASCTALAQKRGMRG